jgi:hypothetical protein
LGLVVFAGLAVEVLAISAFLLFSSLFLSGPIAIILATQRWHIMAVFLGASSCWLGIFWFVTVYTGWKYLGLLSAACGLYAMYKTAQNIQVGP